MAPPAKRRPGFSRRAQYGRFLGYVIAAGGAVVGAALLAISLIDPTAFAVLRAGAREVTAPVSGALRSARDGVAGVPDAIGDHFGTVAQNRQLRADAIAAGRLVREARTLRRENDRLRRLLRLRDRGATPVVSARLVNSSTSSARRIATLDAGSAQGVRRGMSVRGPDGLIGRVVETSPNTASILLISDAQSIVPVRRTRDGLSAIVMGRGDGLVEVRSAGVANAALLSGDTFVTSGTGGLYPPGTPVARIMRSARDTAPARVFADPDGLDFATVQQVFLRPPVPQATPVPVR